MQALTKPCQNCKKPMNGGVFRASHVCPHCLFEHPTSKQRKRKLHLHTAPAAQQTASSDTTASIVTAEVPIIDAAPSAPLVESEPVAIAPAPTKSPDAPVAEAVTATASKSKVAAPVAAKKLASNTSITLTTKLSSDYDILAVIDDVNAECVLSVELTPDLFKDGKFVGSKSEKVVAALKQGKKNVLDELRNQANDIGANMVTNISIKNGMKFQGTQTANVIVSASGLAVVAEVTEDLTAETDSYM